jgi:hypothetical protein
MVLDLGHEPLSSTFTRCSSSLTPIGSANLFGLPGTRCSAAVSPCSISFSTPLTQYEVLGLGVVLDGQFHSTADAGAQAPDVSPTYLMFG